jgi:membrane protein
LRRFKGFENSRHVLVSEAFSSIYDCCRYVGVLSILLLVTVGIIVVFEVFIHKLTGNQVLNEQIPLIVMGGMVLILMILITTSILLKFGTKHDKTRAFISIGSVFTTVWAIIISYFFGIWVIQFSQYNQLYGSIGTLLIMMFYIWINCMILLLGFELNATITKLKETVLLN